MTGKPTKNLYGKAKNFLHELLDAPPCILVTCGGKTSQIYPLAHCGRRGTAKTNRPLDKQKQDWKRIKDDDIFLDALYVVHTNQSGYTSDYFFDLKGKVHAVPDDKKTAKFYDRLPNFSQPKGSDWTFFYQGMGNGYFVNNKVVDAYLAKSRIKGLGADQPFEEDAALETIAELHG